VDLRAGAAGARLTHRPEVLVLSEAEDLVGRETDLPLPDLRSLVVLAKDAHHQALRLEAESLGDELPGVPDRLDLEVVAEGEVSEHLEEGVVSSAPAHLLEVVVLAGDAHAFLGGGGPAVVTALLAEEEPLEGNHPRVHEEQRRVAFGDEGRARQTPVPLRLEEAEEGFANLLGRARNGCHREDSLQR
jgi:hypothetical protein